MTHVLIDPPCLCCGLRVICTRRCEHRNSKFLPNTISITLVMMRFVCTFAVLFIALAAASTPVSAQSTAIINIVSYADGITNCTGGISSEDVYHATGVCMSSSQYFCDSSYFYQVRYSNESCVTGTETSVQKQALSTCMSGKTYTCVNATLGPPYTVGFPPTAGNWLESIQYVDTKGQQSCPIFANSTEIYRTAALSVCTPVGDGIAALVACQGPAHVSEKEVSNGNISFERSSCINAHTARVVFSA